MQAAHHRPHVNYKWIRTDRKYLEIKNGCIVGVFAVRTSNIAVVHHPDVKSSNSNDSRDLEKLPTNAGHVHSWRDRIQENPT